MLENTTTVPQIRAEIFLYKILRKVGVNREYIKPENSFNRDLFFDEKDWICFLFLLESGMNISLHDNMVKKMNTIGDAINIVNNISKHKYNFN